MGINQESATIDPHKSKDIAGTQIKGLVYSQLLKYYHGRQLVPDLAEKYETVNDTTYVFTSEGRQVPRRRRADGGRRQGVLRAHPRSGQRARRCSSS